jgi:hypothetical protein
LLTKIVLSNDFIQLFLQLFRLAIKLIAKHPTANLLTGKTILRLIRQGSQTLMKEPEKDKTQATTLWSFADKDCTNHINFH